MRACSITFQHLHGLGRAVTQSLWSHCGVSVSKTEITDFPDNAVPGNSGSGSRRITWEGEALD